MAALLITANADLKPSELAVDGQVVGCTTGIETRGQGG
jgi:hypothetical protein